MQQEEVKEPTAQVMEFVVFAIECTAQKMGLTGSHLYRRLRRVGLVDRYLIGCYDTLHTQGREYIADAVEEALLNWEAYYTEKGELPNV